MFFNLMTKLFGFLENTESTKFKRIIYKLFIPIFFILEYIVYKYFWEKIIIPEIITNDEIFNFIDNNEFGIKYGRFVKKDLIDTNEYYDSMKIDEARVLIKEEFVKKLTMLIDKNCLIDIENYITLQVLTKELITSKNGNYYNNKLYTVYIQFCRYFYLIRSLKILIYWILILLSIFILILKFGTFFNQYFHL